MTRYETVRKNEIFHLQKCKEKLKNLIVASQNTLSALEQKQMSIPQKLLDAAIKDANDFLKK